jgi:hypothetical protein
MLTGRVRDLNPSNTYFFALTAYSTSGNESAYSHELVWDNGPPTMRWLVVTLDIEVADGPATMPDVRQFVEVEDNVSKAADIILAQTPEPGAALAAGDHVATVRAVDEAGNVATLEMDFTVRTWIHMVPREVRGDYEGRQLQVNKEAGE